MSQIPVLTPLWNALTSPVLPRTALAVTESHLALVELLRRGGGFEPRRLAVQRLPDGLVRASLTEPNVADEAAFAEQLAQTAAQAQLKGRVKLSVTLPEGSARSFVVTLDQEPGSRAELEQMLDWKISRSLGGAPAGGGRTSGMRVTHQRLSKLDGHSRWLAAAVHEEVVGQYERVFRQLGWQAGAILPQHLGEAQWLLRAGLAPAEDQALVSVHAHGFTAVIVRGAEPLLVREVVCEPQEREDEFYRLMVFYRDRLHPAQPISRLLVIGSHDEQQSFWRTLASALETNPHKLTPQHLGLNVEATAPFTKFAAAAGLATLAWG
jgi:Tfp pilus assembly PilM family ATPase